MLIIFQTTTLNLRYSNKCTRLGYLILKQALKYKLFFFSSGSISLNMRVLSFDDSKSNHLKQIYDSRKDRLRRKYDQLGRLSGRQAVKLSDDRSVAISDGCRNSQYLILQEDKFRLMIKITFIDSIIWSIAYFSSQ